MGRLVAGLPPVYSGVNILMLSHLFAIINPKCLQFAKDRKTTFFVVMLFCFGTHQLLAYADDVNILGGSVHTVKENAETLVVASKETGID